MPSMLSTMASMAAMIVRAGGRVVVVVGAALAVLALGALAALDHHGRSSLVQLHVALLELPLLRLFVPAEVEQSPS